MLESLTDRLGNALRSLRGQAKLTEENMTESLQEVRKALLAADVHFRVAREFIDRVAKQCEGQAVLKSVTPGQMIVKIIHDELVSLLGEGSTALEDKKPLRVLLLGLQGSGKTTFAGKLALHLRKNGYTPAVIACDVYRPAAIDQLETLARDNDILFYGERDSKNVRKIGRNGWEWAKEQGADAIIFDTAGRLQIDEPLVKEVVDLKKEVQPDESILVADAALGQEAVNVAKTFHEAVGLTGIALSKLDGDTRGGAALSMKAIAQVPIKFLGTGEKVTDLEVFHPDRLAGRILGMGDVVSLVEKAQDTIDEDEAKRMAEKMQRAEFNFEDFLSQMQAVKKMGSLGGLMKMMPGMGNVEVGDKEEKKLKHTEALIQSMTLQERQNPQLLNGSRRARISRGAGLPVKDLNALIKQFQQMKKMMRMMKGPKARKMMKKMQKSGAGMPDMPDLGNMGGMGGLPRM
ncbi:signal recognition particle protein [Puniceicoccales bacterium CK1056]|uniref:Signal recognition particle protein n=1 Tax=Oceanipulchritudo coccoides TaxID=2706888 RepID=A0A6B2M090_9BACT|nr:signal recognition particle protein [Oceanipulchritudo coccoides]NDV61812.1 signal recognition particle protein [Oceanipulchritudo coccoides]